MARYLDNDLLEYIKKNYRGFGGTKTPTEIVRDYGSSSATFYRYVKRLKKVLDSNASTIAEQEKGIKPVKETNKISLVFNGRRVSGVSFEGNTITVVFETQETKPIVTSGGVGKPFTEKDRKSIMSYIKQNSKFFGGKMNQEQIARHLDVSQSTVARYIRKALMERNRGKK